MIKAFMPELVVLALFLTSDLFWDGYVSAAAGIVAGIVAFLLLLVFKKRKPALVIEGLIFGGITALGEFVDYPGGTVILMELVIAFVLLISLLFGADVISKMLGDIGRGLFSQRQSRVLSITLGSVLLVHSLVSTVLAVSGLLTWWIGGIVFLLLYLPALRLSGSRMKSAVTDSMPLLVEDGEGVFKLVAEGMVSGTIKLPAEAETVVTADICSVEVPSHEFLRQLEAAMRNRGLPGMILNGWTRDEIELEIAGFILINGKWRKRF